MNQRQARTAWTCAVGTVVAAPAVGWLATGPTEPFWDRLSVLTGLLALSALVCAAVLPSRLRSVSRAFGIETVLDVHRFLGTLTAVLVLVHLACVIAADPAATALLNLPDTSYAARAASGATAALVVLAGLAILCRGARLPYELWRWLHLALTLVVLVFSALHVWWLDQLVNDPALGAMLALLAVGVLGVAAHRWVWRPLFDPSAEFVVREVRRENASVSTLVLAPRNPGGATWPFAPGQFAWLRLERSVMAEEHPFTIASSAHAGSTEFTIRHSGDFSRALRRLPPGSRVWVDGPHGAFTTEFEGSAGFVLIAGGVGVTPMMSMLRTAAHRHDPRPYRLIVTARAPEDLLFRAELGALRLHLDLEVTEVLRRPTEGWSGHTGEIGVGLLRAVLDGAEQPEDIDYFICGPPAMVTDCLGVLDVLGATPARVHTEQFDFV
jgi:predicted ferric reductase